jgi:aspartate dehydrogenase
MKKKVGLIGFGLIGQYLYRKINTEPWVDLCFIYDADPRVAASVPANLLAQNIMEMKACEADLVIEVAHPDAVRKFGLQLLESGSDLVIFSLTSLSDSNFRKKINDCVAKLRRKIYIPHGAILGLDGIHDGKKVIEKVKIRTIKHPSKLGVDNLEVSKPTVLYSGSTKGACKTFPRNVNVHAAVALAGIGFEKTVSEIIADPETRTMAHEIDVSGNGLRWRIRIQSDAVGNVTGAYTPESAFRTVERILNRGAGFHLG